MVVWQLDCLIAMAYELRSVAISSLNSLIAVSRRYWDYSYYPPKEGSESSSPSWVASHYISPEEMLTLETLHELKCEGAGQQPWDAASTFGGHGD